MSNEDFEVPRKMFTAPEVAQMIVSGTNDFNYWKWKTLTVEQKAEAFDDLVQFIANQKSEKNLSREMNLASFHIDVLTELEKTFDRWAANEISASRYVGMVEPWIIPR